MPVDNRSPKLFLWPFAAFPVFGVAGIVYLVRGVALNLSDERWVGGVMLAFSILGLALILQYTIKVDWHGDDTVVLHTARGARHRIDLEEGAALQTAKRRSRDILILTTPRGRFFIFGGAPGAKRLVKRLGSEQLRALL